MPVLKTKRETKKVVLPSDKEAWIEVYESQNYGDTKAIQSAALSKMKMTQGGPSVGKDKREDPSVEVDLPTLICVTLNRMIVGWNFTDENKNPLPVNEQNIEFLNSDDAMFVFGEISGETDEEKEEKEKGQGVSSES